MVKSDAIDFGVHLQEILIAFVAPLTTDDEVLMESVFLSHFLNQNNNTDRSDHAEMMRCDAGS